MPLWRVNKCVHWNMCIKRWVLLLSLTLTHTLCSRWHFTQALKCRPPITQARPDTHTAAATTHPTHTHTQCVFYWNFDWALCVSVCVRTCECLHSSCSLDRTHFKFLHGPSTEPWGTPLSPTARKDLLSSAAWVCGEIMINCSKSGPGRMILTALSIT